MSKQIQLLIVLVAVLFGGGTFQSAHAEGGQLQKLNPILGEGCFYTLPPGIDTADCQQITSSDRSLPTLLSCNVDLVVFCPDGVDDTFFSDDVFFPNEADGDEENNGGDIVLFPGENDAD